MVQPVRDPRDELYEACLQARWSLDELAVYGDALIAEGDMRGELIALDLHREPRPRPIKWSRQRLALFDMAPLLPRLALLPRVRAPRSLWPWPHQFALGDSLVLDQKLTIKPQALAAELELRYDASGVKAELQTSK